MDEIKSLYDKVFDADGNVMLCGRECCKNLIFACDKEYQRRYGEEVDFGSIRSGFMNIANIKQFVSSDGARLFT